MPDWTTILKEVIPSPCYDQRPFVCDGFPDACEVIVIGENPATKTNIAWWTWWKDDTRFDYKSFMESYNSERDKPSRTRRRLDRIRSKGINCVETNAYSNEQSGGVSQSIENYAVLDVLMKNMPLLKGIIAHGKKAQQSLENLEVPADILGCVDISPQPDESGSKMKEAKVSGVQLLKPGEDPAVMLYLVDEAFDQMTLPV